MTVSAQEPFRLGRVIGRSFSIWARTLALLFTLVVVVSVPRILFEVYLMLAPPDPPPPLVIVKPSTTASAVSPETN